MNDVVKAEVYELITADKITEYMNVFGIAAELTDNEKKQFVEVATAYQLNPFKKEIYCLPYMTSVKQANGQYKKVRKLSIVTGYETYLKRAERSGLLNGWNVEISGQGDSRTAKITIHRKDWEQPLIHSVILSEYKEDNRMWKEKPMTMLKKVAMAQGFRLAFPDEMGGMPYAAEELPEEMTRETKKAEPSSAPADPGVVPDTLKNSNGEIELKPGNHQEIMKKLNKCKNENHIQSYFKVRDAHTWTEEELKEQDEFIAVLRAQWKEESEAADNIN